MFSIKTEISSPRRNLKFERQTPAVATPATGSVRAWCLLHITLRDDELLLVHSLEKTIIELAAGFRRMVKLKLRAKIGLGLRGLSVSIRPAT